MTSVFVFISGATLLVFSAEKLIGYLVGAASGLRVSLFLLAIVFTGIEFDDIFLGVALNLEDLSGVALGTVFGTAISLTGVVLAIAAILTPVRLQIPRDYIALLAAAPLVMIVFTLTAPLTFVDGVVLVGLFVLFIAYVAVRESQRKIPVFRNAEIYAGTAGADVGREEQAEEPPGNSFADEMPFAEARRLPGWAGLALALLALTGLIIGAATTGIGVEGILEAYGIEGTLFGATIVTAVLTLEDVFLTVEPIRRGAPEVGIGNVIGSVVFSVTGKLGVIILAGGAIVVGPDVLTWHLTALIAVTGLAAAFLYTGRLQRWHGYVLLALYVAYWILSFVVFGGAPIEMD
ncbi:sodium:proton exchanger [Pseudonocardia sp. KRD-184]|uniref:Sodium:proton exchanger n=1 Tax=Pseudonocardia oceani TaxID=2792013 RepID=A0ABS6UH28_9PSEU|nr:sodium:proton exchanger [Pseudonocardia oceani]MBW0090966.1 sodium:proton exchanger [Pseudonocardia oceani]MBW0096252.1 sodium:proton exchanger [Pseudonocardia oceani]MBW0112591.1 sodium:proton exchanger [Pseudonocardia oceani]MBW0120131.1 sodium:proton exchanger [Pseudonocardia oceani]MBW0131551.1 sodium:proton exchanger [Pseudonocardia oceani]